MFCEHCGKPMDKYGDFCGSCGKKRNTGNSVPQSTNKTNATYIPPVQTTHPPTIATTVNKTYQNNNTQPRKKKKMGMQTLIIVILLQIIIIGGFVLGRLAITKDKDSNTPATAGIATFTPLNTGTPLTSAPIPTLTLSPVPTPTAQPDYFDMDQINDIIRNRTSASNVSVAVLDFDSGQCYETSNAHVPFVAAGFYTPLYVVANNSSRTNTTIAEKLNTMMRTMDNSAANYIIDTFGGFNRVNGILYDSGYAQTTFGRKFGDVEASKKGNENYTSARDAALILLQVYNYGGYLDMKTDLRKDGIILPSTGTVYAHRGLGIGTSFNVFVIIDTPQKSYAVAILTTDTGTTAESAKTNAAPLISELLAAISEQSVFQHE